MINVKDHDSPIRKRLYKYDLFGKVAGEILFSLKRTLKEQLRFVKLHLNKPQG